MTQWATRLGPFDRTEVGKVQKLTDFRIIVTINGRVAHWPTGNVWLFDQEDAARQFSMKIDGAKGEQDRRVTEARLAFRKTVARLASELAS